MCTGNTCRSPMAAALLHHAFDRAGRAGVRVRSVGTLGWSGRPATDAAVAALAEVGVDLSGHVSTKIDTDAVTSADVIVAMTRIHAGAVVAHDPDAVHRTFLLPELSRLATRLGAPAPGETPRSWAARAVAIRPRPHPIGRPGDEVDDPAGHPLDVYRTTRDLLQRHVDTFVDVWAPERVAGGDERAGRSVGAVGAQPGPDGRLG